MKFGHRLGTFIFLCSLVFLLSQASALTYIDSCQTISSSGEYVLNQSITGNDTNCIQIDADDVIFDCAGYSITNVGTNSDYGGIVLLDFYTNATIKNCNLTDNYKIYVNNFDGVQIYDTTITGSYEGIRFLRTNNTYIRNLVVSNVERQGIICEDCNNITVEDSSFTNVGASGSSTLKFYGDVYNPADYTGVTVDNVTVTNGYRGILLTNMDDVSVYNTVFSTFDEDGGYVSYSNNLWFENVTFNSSTFNGITFDTVSNMTLKSVEAHNNPSTGIYCYDCDNSYFLDLDFSNSFYSFSVSYSDNSIFDNLHFSGNGAFYVGNSNNNTVRNVVCDFAGGLEDELYLYGDGNYLYNAEVYNSDYGLTVRGSNNYVEDVLVENTADGITIRGSGTTIKDSVVHNVTSRYVYVRGSSSPISDILIENLTTYGDDIANIFELDNVDGITIRNSKLNATADNTGDGSYNIGLHTTGDINNVLMENNEWHIRGTHYFHVHDSGSVTNTTTANETIHIYSYTNEDPQQSIFWWTNSDGFTLSDSSIYIHYPENILCSGDFVIHGDNIRIENVDYYIYGTPCSALQINTYDTPKGAYSNLYIDDMFINCMTQNSCQSSDGAGLKVFGIDNGTIKNSYLMSAYNSLYLHNCTNMNLEGNAIEGIDQSVVELSDNINFYGTHFSTMQNYAGIDCYYLISVTDSTANFYDTTTDLQYFNNSYWVFQIEDSNVNMENMDIDIPVASESYYGIRYYNSNGTVNNSVIDGVYSAMDLYGDSHVVSYNTVYNVLDPSYGYAGVKTRGTSTLELYNCTIEEKENLTAGDTSQIDLYWKLTVNNSFGATVDVYDYLNNLLIEFTDSLLEMWVRELYVDSIGITYLTPHTIVSQKDGYQTKSDSITMDSNKEYTVMLEVMPPTPPSTMFRVLSEAGDGLSGFFTGMTDPLVNVLVAFGVVVGVLAIFGGVAYAIRNAFAKSTK